jgi:16S rRNA (cytidine1402-2'-O)-methyltransferase
MSAEHPENSPESRHYCIGALKFPTGRCAGGLHIVATPIGNLKDITLRALETLAGVDLIACEDTRVTGKLLSHYGISTPLMAYHDHNGGEMRPKIMARIRENGSVALVSDAGTPLISDPGYKLVADLREEGLPVFPIPGASALTAAVASAGLPSDTFLFAGFLPNKRAARLARATSLKAVQATLVFYETGPRLAASLADLSAALGPRQAAMCRELTKTFEEVRRGTLPELAAHYAGDSETRGEIVLVIGPPLEEATDVADLDSALRDALARLSVKDASAEVASMLGLPKRDVYQRALELGRAP